MQVLDPSCSLQAVMPDQSLTPSKLTTSGFMDTIYEIFVSPNLASAYLLMNQAGLQIVIQSLYKHATLFLAPAAFNPSHNAKKNHGSYMSSQQLITSYKVLRSDA